MRILLPRRSKQGAQHYISRPKSNHSKPSPVSHVLHHHAVFFKLAHPNDSSMRHYSTDNSHHQNQPRTNSDLSYQHVGHTFQEATKTLQDYIHQEIEKNDKKLKDFIENENSKLADGINKTQEASAKAARVLNDLTATIDKHRSEEEKLNKTLGHLEKRISDAWMAIFLMLLLIVFTYVLNGNRNKFVENFLSIFGFYNRNARIEEKGNSYKSN